MRIEISHLFRIKTGRGVNGTVTILTTLFLTLYVGQHLGIVLGLYLEKRMCICRTYTYVLHKIEEKKRDRRFYGKKARGRNLFEGKFISNFTTCRSVTLFPHEILTHSPFTMDRNYTRRLLIRSCNARASRPPQMSSELLISVVTDSRSILHSHYEIFYAWFDDKYK